VGVQAKKGRASVTVPVNSPPTSGSLEVYYKPLNSSSWIPLPDGTNGVVEMGRDKVGPARLDIARRIIRTHDLTSLLELNRII